MTSKYGLTVGIILVIALIELHKVIHSKIEDEMRKWSVKELESIETDFMLIGELADEDGIRGIPEDDAAWLSARINKREMHGNFYEARCDACGIEGARIMAFVDEHHDGMGTLPDLLVTYLCYMDR